MPVLRSLSVLFLLGLVPMLGVAATADAPPSLSRAEQSLRDAELRRFEAMVARDLPALDKALATELVYTHATGVQQDKTGLLKDLEGGVLVYRRLEPLEQHIRLHGSLGIITGVLAMTATAAGAERDQRLRYTDIYVRRAGRWQLLAWQSTRMPDPN